MSAMEPSTLALFWAGVMACSILAYVILDGFDLGVGILFGTTRNEQHRDRMMSSIAPFWDGNETWLVVVGAGLYASFPSVYAVFLGAFYLPVLLLLVGLIFRGIAFEFRARSQSNKHVWERGFFLGSTVVAFVQGAAIGAMMRGLPVENGVYTGTAMEWLHPFAVLTGCGLVFGYSLLGAGWIALKNEGQLRDWAFARIPWLAAGVVLIMAMALTTTIDYSLLARGNFEHTHWEIVIPLIGMTALAGAVFTAWLKRDNWPFPLTAMFFLAAYLTLGKMFWPYMIPYSITVASAAAPEESLQFLFYGAVAVLPVITVYTIGVYWVFRGKTQT